MVIYTNNHDTCEKNVYSIHSEFVHVSQPEFQSS